MTPWRTVLDGSQPHAHASVWHSIPRATSRSSAISHPSVGHLSMDAVCPRVGCSPLVSRTLHADVVEAVKEGRRAGMAGDCLGMGDRCLTCDGAAILALEGLIGAEGNVGDPGLDRYVGIYGWQPLLAREARMRFEEDARAQRGRPSRITAFSVPYVPRSCLSGKPATVPLAEEEACRVVRFSAGGCRARRLAARPCFLSVICVELGRMHWQRRKALQ